MIERLTSVMQNLAWGVLPLITKLRIAKGQAVLMRKPLLKKEAKSDGRYIQKYRLW